MRGDGRVHVLFFTSALGGGGAEKHLVRVANALDRGRFRVSVAVARGGGSYEGELAADVAYHPLPGGRMRNAMLPLRRLLRTERPDVLCSFMDHANCIALLASRGLADGPAVVAGVQNPPSTSLNRVLGPIRGAIKAGMRALYPRADAVVALSRGVGDELERMIPGVAGRLAVIPNAGMDDAPAAPSGVTNRSMETDGPVLVACGRLVPQKDYPVLLRALARVREQLPARLRILGEGPLRAELQALAASLGVADAVSWEGFQPDPTRYMAAADVFVLSSAYEGFGNVIVEAMAAGAPVVATDCPYGPGEILEGGRHGVLVPPGDPGAFADALLRVLRDPALRERLRAAGLARVAAYAPAAIAGEYGRLFQDVLAARAAAPVRGAGARGAEKTAFNGRTE
ncbi:glycosyltransferase [Longimicrobium sp.]|uniref:glycosyltransferase n=1 Tax=Longimicrobium sp. TaxID=2029185 RepID=UPI003B3B1BD5